MNTALLSCSVLKFSMIKLVWRSQAYKMDEKTLSIARMHTLLSLYFFLFFHIPTYLPNSILYFYINKLNSENELHFIFSEAQLLAPGQF